MQAAGAKASASRPSPFTVRPKPAGVLAGRERNSQMARKPNYQFERMERDRQKAIKAAQKAAAKASEKAAQNPDSAGNGEGSAS